MIMKSYIRITSETPSKEYEHQPNINTYVFKRTEIMLIKNPFVENNPAN